ncbi:hypothetical protein MVEN_00851900 [Mycena venus]|uniref:Uncharacterized protein n=1 Tax=Mycena venus TaxID=2733690 RepID=A0A8H7D3H5_9AGAR|nr:hypothetical protein MVEN_00851900 [Mycena venus]
MSLFSIVFALFLAVSGARAQDECAQVPSTVAAEVSAMNAFITRTPPPTSNPTDCHSASLLKSEIDLAGQAETTQGCGDIYNQTILANDQFAAGYTFLTDFLQLC